MKILGAIVLVVGLVWALIAFNTETTITTEDQYIGNIYIPSQKVHNIGKMDDRKNHLMLSALTILIGTTLLIFGVAQSTKIAPNLMRKLILLKKSARIARNT